MPISAQRPFQKAETKRESLSETMLRGSPLVQITRLKNTWAASTAVAEVWVGIKKAYFVSLSTTTIMASNPALVSGNLTIKSIETDAHRSSEISNGCSVPAGEVVAPLFCWQAGQLRIYSAIIFFIWGHQNFCCTAASTLLRPKCPAMPVSWCSAMSFSLSPAWAGIYKRTPWAWLKRKRPVSSKK